MGTDLDRKETKFIVLLVRLFFTQSLFCFIAVHLQLIFKMSGSENNNNNNNNNGPPSFLFQDHKDECVVPFDANCAVPRAFPPNQWCARPRS